MLFEVEISQEIEIQGRFLSPSYIRPIVGHFQVTANSFPEAVRKVENDERFKEIKNAFISNLRARSGEYVTFYWKITDKQSGA